MNFCTLHNYIHGNFLLEVNPHGGALPYSLWPPGTWLTFQGSLQWLKLLGVMLWAQGSLVHIHFFWKFAMALGMLAEVQNLEWDAYPKVAFNFHFNCMLFIPKKYLNPNVTRFHPPLHNLYLHEILQMQCIFFVWDLTYPNWAG